MSYKNFDELAASLFRENGEFIFETNYKYSFYDYIEELAKEKNYILKNPENLWDEDLLPLFGCETDTGKEYLNRYYEKRTFINNFIKREKIYDLKNQIYRYVLDSIFFIKRSGVDVNLIVGFSRELNDIDTFSYNLASSVINIYYDAHNDKG